MFKKNRLQHYNMANALSRGKHLIEHDDDEEGDSPKQQSQNGGHHPEKGDTEDNTSMEH